MADFDPEAGRQARDQAMAAADSHAHRVWKLEIDTRIYNVALISRYFTTDDIIDDVDHQTHEPRALGARMTAARNRGWIQNTHGPQEPSKIPRRHRRGLDVWESLIYEPRRNRNGKRRKSLALWQEERTLRGQAGYSFR